MTRSPTRSSKAGTSKCFSMVAKRNKVQSQASIRVIRVLEAWEMLVRPSMNRYSTASYGSKWSQWRLAKHTVPAGWCWQHLVLLDLKPKGQSLETQFLSPPFSHLSLLPLMGHFEHTVICRDFQPGVLRLRPPSWEKKLYCMICKINEIQETCSLGS